MIKGYPKQGYWVYQTSYLDEQLKGAMLIELRIVYLELLQVSKQEKSLEVPQQPLDPRTNLGLVDLRHAP